MLKIIVGVLSIALIGGCATTSGGRGGAGIDVEASKTVNLVKSIDAAKSPEELSALDRTKLEEAMASVLAYCQPKLSGYEAIAAGQAKRAYWLSMSGLILGSVVAPALTAANAAGNAAWISAASGWGGATNFAGEALKTSGLSGTTIAQTRNKIIDGVMADIKTASDGAKTFEQRRDALMSARASCTLYQIAVPTVGSNPG